MLRIPKLARSGVCNSCECATAGRPPVCRWDRLRDNEYPHLPGGVPRQQLLSCGGPPQAGWSSWRQQQD